MVKTFTTKISANNAVNIAYHSDSAREINKLIFETIYHAALESSYEISLNRSARILEYLNIGFKGTNRGLMTPEALSTS